MAIDRRTFLRVAGLGGTVGCLCCAAAARLAAAADATHHWGYAGEGGPDHWGELSAEFKVCRLGLEQTPIDLADGMRGNADAAKLEYRALPFRIINNGLTIQVNADPGCNCTIGAASYELLQFHFHHPSEHLLSGKHLDLECHFVHRSASGDLAVLGVFITPGERNAALAALSPNNARPAQRRNRRFVIEAD
jgi:carbonic anhydrase